MAGQQQDSAEHSDQQPQHRHHVGRGKPASNSSTRQHGQAEARRRYQIHLDATTASDHVDLVSSGCHAGGDQRLGDGEPGQDVAGRPTSRHYEPPTTDPLWPKLQFCTHGVWRAMFSKIPNAVRLRMVELPP